MAFGPLLVSRTFPWVRKMFYVCLYLQWLLSFFEFFFSKRSPLFSFQSKSFRLFLKIALVTLLSFLLLLFPFLWSSPKPWDMTCQIFSRLFPLSRGLYEDKVANVWCALSPFLKFKNYFTINQLVSLSGLSTLIVILPGSIGAFLCSALGGVPNSKLNASPFSQSISMNQSSGLLLSLVTSSLGFFLFSFQVHEKTILIPLLPLLLLLGEERTSQNYKDSFITKDLILWMVNMSSFSLWPLALRDGQGGVSFVLLLAFWNLLVWSWSESVSKSKELNVFMKETRIRFGRSIIFGVGSINSHIYVYISF